MPEVDHLEDDEELWTWFAPVTPRPAGLHAVSLGPMTLTIDRLSGNFAGVEIEINELATWDAGDRAIVNAILGTDDPGRAEKWAPEQTPQNIRELVTLLAALGDTGQMLQRATVGYVQNPRTITSIEQYVIWPGALNGCIAAHGLETIDAWSRVLEVIGAWPSDCAVTVRNHLDWCCNYLEHHVDPETLALNQYPRSSSERSQSELKDWCSPAFVQAAHVDLRGYAGRLGDLLLKTTGHPEMQLNALRRLMPVRENGAYDGLTGSRSPQAAEPLALDDGRLARLDNMLAATVFGWVALLIASSPHGDFDDNGRISRLWLASAVHWDTIERGEDADRARRYAAADIPPRPSCIPRWTAFARGLPAPPRTTLVLN